MTCAHPAGRRPSSNRSEPIPDLHELPSTERHPRAGVWALAIGVLGVLLFTWPFVRTPPLGIGASYAHLLGAWLAIVAALVALSRTLARDARGGADRE